MEKSDRILPSYLKPRVINSWLKKKQARRVKLSKCRQTVTYENGENREVQCEKIKAGFQNRCPSLAKLSNFIAKEVRTYFGMVVHAVFFLGFPMDHYSQRTHVPSDAKKWLIDISVLCFSFFSLRLRLAEGQPLRDKQHRGSRTQEADLQRVLRGPRRLCRGERDLRQSVQDVRHRVQEQGCHQHEGIRKGRKWKRIESPSFPFFFWRRKQCNEIKW